LISMWFRETKVFADVSRVQGEKKEVEKIRS
jgi:hypothetical protein